jgi:hypothetical protein
MQISNRTGAVQMNRLLYFLLIFAMALRPPSSRPHLRSQS